MDLVSIYNFFVTHITFVTIKIKMLISLKIISRASIKYKSGISLQHY